MKTANSYYMTTLYSIEGPDEEMLKEEESILIEHFGKQVRFYRKLRSLTQEELGELASVSYKYIGEIERGSKKVSIIVMSRLARALGVTIAELLSSPDDRCAEDLECILFIGRLLNGKDPLLQKKVAHLIKAFLEMETPETNPGS